MHFWSVSGKINPKNDENTSKYVYKGLSLGSGSIWDQNRFLERKISSKTIAILAVDIFGQSEDLDGIKKIIKNKKIKIISDAAQAIGSRYKKKYSGTLSDIGGFSFNYHKHINTGEGGMIVTNN